MATTWKDVRAALETGDNDKVNQYREDILESMETKATQEYLNRFSIQSLSAKTWCEVLTKLKADKEDVIAGFKIELLKEFNSRHGLTVYTDVSQIQPGDTVIVSWKNKGQTYFNDFRVLEPQGDQWLVTLSMWEHDETQFKAHERAETINKKNFIVGVRQKTPPIMKEPQKFYFINFNEMELNFTSFETAVKQFLDNLASEDAAFAKTYQKPNKSVSECCKYIYQEVEKNRKGAKCVACTDEEVFGLAIHYYDEDDIVVEGPKAEVEAVASSQPEATAKAENAPIAVESPKPKLSRKKASTADPNIPEPLEIPLF